MKQSAQTAGNPMRGARSLTARGALGFVVLLGVVSLFADMTYEGGRSLVGQYLGLLGAGAAAVAVTAGAGEFLGYALRFVSGWAADRTRRYWGITLAGYVLNLLAVPALALAGGWQLAVALVFAERIGKAIRNPSRDAMLAFATTRTGRGFGYGLHEAMDQIGAVLGPLLLSLILYLQRRTSAAGGEIAGYRLGFLVLLAPACLALLALGSARVLFPRPADFELPDKRPRLETRGYSRAYWIYLSAAALMAAGITDFPLIAFHFQRQSLVPQYWLPTMFALAMAVDAGSALLFGVLYDRIGFRVLVVMFAVEAGTAPLLFLGGFAPAIAGMALWGISMGTQESIMRAAVADLIPADRRATGFGLFHMVFGAAWFAGSALMGLLYQRDVRLLVAFAVLIQALAIPLVLLAGATRRPAGTAGLSAARRLPRVARRRASNSGGASGGFARVASQCKEASMQVPFILNYPIYLDHNATTPVHAEVVEAVLPWLREHFGNPSSTHVYGRRAQAAVEKAREQVAALLGCEADEVFFTSGGTEANNLAILGSAGVAGGARRHVVSSVVEHPATARPCERLERQGWALTCLPVDGEGRVAAEQAREALRADTALVSVMLANNETGALMPIREIANIAHARGALMHTDAAQAVGKVAVRVQELGVDLLSVAGHKLYAPKGVGALFVRRGTPIQPVLLGAGHERGLRPGTENVPYIVGLGQACEIAARDLQGEASRVGALRDELWERLRAEVPGIRLNGHPSERLPNTLNVCFPGVAGSAVLAAAPEVAASTGSACHEGGEDPSAVLLAMGLEAGTALGAVRLSLGRGTSGNDVVEAAGALIRAWQEISSRG